MADTQSIASAFRWASYLLGVPSIGGTAVFGVTTAVLWWTRPKDSGPSSSTNTAVRLFEDGFRLFGKLFGLIGDIGLWLSGILAIVSLVGLVFAAGLFYTARGLESSATWARLAASTMMAVLALVTLLIFLSARGSFIGLLALAIAASSGWMIWMLWRPA